MTEDNMRQRLLALTSLAADYCAVCENAGEMEKSEFIDRMLDSLPRLYWEFFDISTKNTIVSRRMLTRIITKACVAT